MLTSYGTKYDIQALLSQNTLTPSSPLRDVIYEYPLPHGQIF